MAADYDMRQSVEMWANFRRLAMWVMGFCVVTLVFMAIFLT
jgi:hypothetical protein